MKKLLLFLFLIISQFLIAQESSYHQFEEGSAHYLIADNVNVRESASSKGKVIANIPIGTEVKILKKANETLKLNGFETNWYQVEFKAQDKTQSGYVWGGLIAEGWVKSTSDKNIKFMYAIASCKIEEKESYTYYDIKIQLRACKNNKEISKVEFTTRGNLEILPEFKNLGNKGFSNVKDVLVFSIHQYICDGINADDIFFWDGSKLISVFQITSGDALIYPSDEGGKKDRIFIEEYRGESTEDGDVIVHEKAEYQWTGTKLKFIKTLIDKE